MLGDGIVEVEISTAISFLDVRWFCFSVISLVRKDHAKN